VPILVEVDMVGCRHARHPEVRRVPVIDAKLRENLVAEIPVERIFLRKTPKLLHEDSIFTMTAPATQLAFLLRIRITSFSR